MSVADRLCDVEIALDDVLVDHRQDLEPYELRTVRELRDSLLRVRAKHDGLDPDEAARFQEDADAVRCLVQWFGKVWEGDEPCNVSVTENQVPGVISLVDNRHVYVVTIQAYRHGIYE
jgi:hypothetical protein